jgi:site-specific DNA-cytosine methylase
LGGGCDGLEWAGFPVHVAINHDPIAVAIHKARRGLVTVTVRGVDYDITDVGMRMVEPEEGEAARLEAWLPRPPDHRLG